MYLILIDNKLRCPCVLLKSIDTKKRGQNSIYVLEVFDYLTTNIMSKAHAVY